MAYTVTTSTAFNKVDDNDGYDYQSSADLLAMLVAIALGIAYINEEGSFIYLSRLNW